MDSSFPYLHAHQEFVFPPVEKAAKEGIVAAGGNLSPGMLLSAYRQGIFPWYSGGEPVLWWSPDPRCVLFPGNEHISRSMQKVLKKGLFSFSLDTSFKEVISACAEIYRPGQGGETWITPDMEEAYIELHSLGYAHSLEVRHSGRLAGGLYGISLGAVFFGESMFSYEPNASKAGLFALSSFLKGRGFQLIDCQVYHPHLRSLGAVTISRSRFMELLRQGLNAPSLTGSWKDLPDSTPAPRLTVCQD